MNFNTSLGLYNGTALSSEKFGWEKVFGLIKH